MKKNENPTVRKHINHNTPLTREQQELAARHHQTIYLYLQRKRLDISEWYDVAVFGYLRAVRIYTERPDLQRYSFITIANWGMRSEIDKEYQKAKRRVQTFSLDAELTEDGMTLYDLIENPEFLPNQQENNVVAAQYMPLLEVLTERQFLVLVMKSQGYTYKEIAEELGLNTWCTAASAANRGRNAVKKAENKRSSDLKAKTEKVLGYCIPTDLFLECETYARRKLVLTKLRNGGRCDDDFLVQMMTDIIRGMTEKTAARRNRAAIR